MRKLITKIKSFFFPPAGSPIWIRALPFVVLGIFTLAVGVSGVYGWNYTNSPEFCGSACHTMPPQYSAYLESPHARVRCVECHIGRDIVTTQFTRKAGDLRHVVRTITQDYEYPIYAHEMRPARDTCETCHFPEKFSDDSLREIVRFEEDVANTVERTFLVMKTGGGSQREGLGRGIHWHVENEVWFLATDKLQQDIPYVRTVDADGNIKEYYDIAADVTPDDVAGEHLERMDCLTCHNRITHSIPNPVDAVDQALYKGLISPDLPEIKEKAVALLEVEYADQATAFAAFAELDTFYAENYPAAYDQYQDEIAEAIAKLEEIYSQIQFPEQELDWEAHPDNLGHKDFPGCFRCHDGKHLTGSDEAIRLECNVCHSVPVVADDEALVTELEIVRGPEPASHTHTSWIALHGRSIDASCATCHEPADPAVDYTELEGKPPADGSFCGNSACHGPDWEFTGFDVVELIPVLERQLYILQNTSPYLLEGVPRTYEATFAALFNGRCVFCHGGAQPEGGLDLSSYETMLTGGDGGPAFVPGDPANSLIIQRQSEPRDHFGQVLPEELEALRAWVEAGAPRE